MLRHPKALTPSRPLTRKALTLVGGALLGLVLLAPASAVAGQWMRVVCVNPDGSPAGNEGWSGFSTGAPEVGSDNKPNCAPGVPMSAVLTTVAPAAVGTSEDLRYTPPAGSSLVGGSVTVDLFADALSFNASGQALLMTPAYAFDGSNVFYLCAAGLGPCGSPSPNDFSGTVTLPANRGGELFVEAGCGGDPAAVCANGGSFGAWSLANLYSADLLLANSSSPAGSGFAGSLLAPGAHGTSDLTFTSTDPGGPGVYNVTARIDAKTVYSATPNTNAGACAAVATDAATGALMFDSQQPCPQTLALDLPIRTTALADGPHQLAVTVTDAAGNASTVLNQTISTNNRTIVSGLLTSNAPLSASAGGPSYVIVPDPATAKLARGIHRRFVHSALTLTGALQSSNGLPASGVAIGALAQNADANAPQLLASANTDAAGHWQLNVPAGPTRTLTIAYGAQAQAATRITETVSPGLSLQVHAQRGGRLVFTGHLHIRPLGSPRPLVLIEVLNPAGRWQTAASPVRVNARGRYRLTFNGGRKVAGQKYTFRAVAPATHLFTRATSSTQRAVAR